MTEPQSVTLTRTTTNRALTALHRVADAFADPNSVRELAVVIDHQIDAKITRLLAKKAALRALLGVLPAVDHDTTTLGRPQPFMPAPPSPNIAPSPDIPGTQPGIPGIPLLSTTTRWEFSGPSPNGAPALEGGTLDDKLLTRDLVIACAHEIARTNGGAVRSRDIVKAMTDRGYQFTGPRPTTSVSRLLAHSNGFTKETNGDYRIAQPGTLYPPPAVTPQH